MLFKSKTKILVIILFAVPVLVLVMRILDHRSKTKTKSTEIRIAEKSSRKPSLGEVKIIVTQGSPSELAPWQDGEFIEVASNETVQIVNVAVEIEGKDLPVKQRNGLAQLVNFFLQTYSTGRFADYLDFKTRGKKFEFDFSSAASKDLITSFGMTNYGLPKDPEARLQALWEMVSAVHGTRKMSPHLKEIQTNSAKIVISTNYSAKSTLLGYSRGVSSMYPNFAPNSLIKYDQTPGAVIKENGHLVVALIQINARYSTSDTATPFFVTFYWSPQAEQWYPWELAKYRAAKFTVLF